MGYVARSPYRQVEWGTDLNHSDSPVITHATEDVGPFFGTLPVFSGNIILAYMDVLVGVVQNGAAGANALNGAQYLQIKKNGGTYVNAFEFGAEQFTMSAGDKLSVGRLYGDIDIATTIKTIGPGGDYTWQWHNATADADVIYMKGAFQPILRVIFQ